jgi:hypothetical protein
LSDIIIMLSSSHSHNTFLEGGGDHCDTHHNSRAAVIRTGVMFCMRVCIFMLSHVIFYLGPAHSCRELPLMDSVAIASSCLLVITLAWALFEVVRFCVCKAPKPRGSGSSSSSTVLLMSNNNNNSSSSSATATTTTTTTPARFYTQRVQITPWVLWYYVHAIGIIIFVLTYSIPGLSSLPSLSIIGAITICSAMKVCESQQKRGTLYKILQFSWTVCMMVCFVLLLSDLVLEMDAHVWIQSLASNMWMGFVLPVGCCVFLFHFTHQMSFVHLSPSDMFAFTLPSLAMLSTSFLSLYLPFSQSTLYAQLLSKNTSSMLDYHNNLLLLYSSYYNDTSIALHNIPGINNSTLGERIMTYMKQHPFLPQASPMDDSNNNMAGGGNINNTNTNNNNVSKLMMGLPEASWVMHTSMWDVQDANHSVMASIVLTILCPLILFALMIIFLSSFTHMSGKTQGNASAFAMANVLRRFFTGATNAIGAPRILSLMFVILASLIIIYFDAIFKHHDHHHHDNAATADSELQPFHPLHGNDDMQPDKRNNNDNEDDDDEDDLLTMHDANDETVVFRRDP